MFDMEQEILAAKLAEIHSVHQEVIECIVCVLVVFVFLRYWWCGKDGMSFLSTSEKQLSSHL